MKKSLAAISVGFTLLMGATAAYADQLYNGLSLPSQTPDQQGWTYLKTAYPTVPSAQATAGGTILNTGTSKNYAGYFKQSPVPLDRDKGYSISFSVKINSESHSSSNRAGFSIIATSNPSGTETQPYSLELGFWQNSIWAQNVGFTKGESVSFNTQSAVNNYELRIQGTQYQLFVNGSAQPILKGSLRKYNYTPPPGFINPYTTPSLIFMGDDTTSATAKVTLTKVYATPITQTTLTNTGQ